MDKKRILLLLPHTSKSINVNDHIAYFICKLSIYFHLQSRL